MTNGAGRLLAYYEREMADRAARPLGLERKKHLAQFVAMCERDGLRSVVEVGGGAGRDGKVMAAAGIRYSGVDLSNAGVAMCRDLGLDVQQSSAVDLPFGDDDFDAGWSMSTLMHLRGDDMVAAMAELGRVIRSGGVLELGVWGADVDREWTDEHGRYFLLRSDDEFQKLGSSVGTVLAFETWDRFEDGGHYQWMRVVIR